MRYVIVGAAFIIFLTAVSILEGKQAWDMKKKTGIEKTIKK